MATAGAVVVLAAACASDDDSEGPVPSTAQSTQAPADSEVEAFIDVQECENVGGVGTASGTITNDGDDATAFTIEIGFHDADGKMAASAVATTAVAEPGDEVAWEVTVDDLDDADVTCHTIEVAAADDSGSTSDDESDDADMSDEAFPCGLVTTATLESVFGGPAGDGMTDTSNRDESGTVFTTQECMWSAGPAGSSTDLSLGVGQADDFPDGEVGCPPLPGSSTPVDGVGTSASWSWTGAGTSSEVGELRVCTDSALIHIWIATQDDEDSAKQAAVAVATEAAADI